MLLELK